MITENEIIDGCNILFNGRMYSVKWKHVNKVIIRPVDDIGFIETKFDTLEPIQITADILLKIGFIKQDDNTFTYSDNEQKTYTIELRDSNDAVLIIDGNNAGIKLTSVHQLQKIIFELSTHCLSIIENTQE